MFDEKKRSISPMHAPFCSMRALPLSVAFVGRRFTCRCCLTPLPRKSFFFVFGVSERLFEFSENVRDTRRVHRSSGRMKALTSSLARTAVSPSGTWRLENTFGTRSTSRKTVRDCAARLGRVCAGLSKRDARQQGVGLFVFRRCQPSQA